MILAIESLTFAERLSVFIVVLSLSLINGSAHVVCPLHGIKAPATSHTAMTIANFCMMSLLFVATSLLLLFQFVEHVDYLFQLRFVSERDTYFAFPVSGYRHLYRCLEEIGEPLSHSGEFFGHLLF